jgi:hypothetical protein
VKSVNKSYRHKTHCTIKQGVPVSLVVISVLYEFLRLSIASRDDAARTSSSRVQLILRYRTQSKSTRTLLLDFLLASPYVSSCMFYETFCLLPRFSIAWGGSWDIVKTTYPRPPHLVFFHFYKAPFVLAPPSIVRDTNS